MTDDSEQGNENLDPPAAPAPQVRRKPGPRPGTEAAKRGGSAARDKYGREFYSKIGSKGGSKVRDVHGPGFYTEIGRRGGETTKRNLGTDHYSRIGRIGGKHAHNRNGVMDDPPGQSVAADSPEQPREGQEPAS